MAKKRKPYRRQRVRAALLAVALAVAAPASGQEAGGMVFLTRGEYFQSVSLTVTGVPPRGERDLVLQIRTDQRGPPFIYMARGGIQSGELRRLFVNGAELRSSAVLHSMTLVIMDYRNGEYFTHRWPCPEVEPQSGYERTFLCEPED